MSGPTEYVPIDEFPGFNTSGRRMLIQDNGDILLWQNTFRNDYDIQSISNTTPIQVVTDGNNFLLTGDKVSPVGSAVSALNGNVYTITRINSFTFSLDGTTASGAGGASGRVYAAQLGVITRLIDGLHYLGSRLALNSHAAFTYNLGAGNFAAVVNSTSFVDAGSILVDVSGCVVGDKLEINLSAQLVLIDGNGGGMTANAKLVSVEDFGGANTTSDVAGAQAFYNNGVGGPGTLDHLNLTGLTSISTAGTCRIKLQCKVGNAADLIDVEGYCVLRVSRYRL